LETAEGQRIESDFQAMGDYSLFGSCEVKPLARLLLRPGLRLSYNTKFAAPLIPSLNLKYELSEKITIRASYGRGFRAPSLKEIYLNFVDASHNVHGNPNLVAEQSDNFQAFVTVESKTKDKVIRFEPSLFFNSIRNMIDLARINSSNLQMMYINVNEFKSAGLSVNTEYRRPHYNLLAGYSFTARNSTLMQLAQSNSYFYANELRLNGMFCFKKQDLTVSVFYKYNGKLQTYQYNNTNEKLLLSYINAFSLLDASLSKNLINKHLNITLGSKNILNVKNVNANIATGVHAAGSNFALVGMGRSYFITLKYSIEKSKSKS
jgi:outer membrane receptor for ferrienterochelin and colicins